MLPGHSAFNMNFYTNATKKPPALPECVIIHQFPNPEQPDRGSPEPNVRTKRLVLSLGLRSLTRKLVVGVSAYVCYFLLQPTITDCCS